MIQGKIGGVAKAKSVKPGRMKISLELPGNKIHYAAVSADNDCNKKAFQTISKNRPLRKIRIENIRTIKIRLNLIVVIHAPI